MGDRHVIDELHVELAFPDEAAAFEGQSRWEALVQRRLLVVAEEVFERVGRPGEVRRYERVEVDLGTVPPDTSPVETERRFRELLADALRSTPHTAPGAADGDVRVLSRGRSRLEQLQHFLAHGRLPWHASAGPGFDPADLAEDVLRQDGKAFVDWLRSAADRDRLVRRLTQQCGSGVADTVITRLARGDPARIPILVDLLMRSFSRREDGSGPAVLAGIVREAMLQALLAGGAAAHDDAVFAREAFKRVARLLGGTHAGTAARLRDALDRLREMPEPRAGQRSIQQALRQATGLLPATSQHSQTPSMPTAANEAAMTRGDTADVETAATASAAIATSVTELARWRASLDRALVHGDARALAGQWPALLRDHAAIVLDAIRRHGRLGSARRSMAAGLPESMLRDAVRLLEPAQAAFIDALVLHAHAFRAPGGGTPSAADEDRARRQMWAALLDHLLVDRGGRFDRQACLDSVLRRSADRAGIGAAALAARAIAHLEAADAAADAKDTLLPSLRTLAREIGGHAAPDTSQAIAAVDAYHRVATALFDDDGRLAHAAPVSAAEIAHLASRFPRQFARLHGELCARALDGTTLVARLDGPALRELVIALARLRQASAGALLQEDLPEPADDGSVTADDAHATLGYLVDRLLYDASADPAAILAQARRIAQSNPRTPDSRTPDTTESITHRIDGWLARGSVDAGDDAWQHMVAEQPALLRSALRRLAVGKGAPQAFAATFSAPMVDDVVRLFAPDGAAFLAIVLHHPGRRDTGAGGAASAQRARHVREFTIAYLLADRGGAFNKRMYLGNLVRRMAAEANLHYEELLATLVDALAGAPADSGAPREMQDVLRTLANDAARSVARRSRGASTAVPRTASQQRPDAAPDRTPPLRRDAGAAANAAHHGRTPATRVAVPPKNQSRAAVDPTIAELARLSWTLRRPGSAAAPDAARTDASLRRLLHSAPAALRRLLDRVLEDRHAIERAVSLLPEPTLARVLALLRPGPFADAQRCADIVTTASLGANAGLPAAELRSLRWRFAFEHLVAEGRAFRLGTFVRGLMAGIASRLSAARFLLWRRQTVDRLSDDRIVADRSAVRAIVDVMTPPRAPSPDDVAGAPSPPPITALPAPGEALQVTNAGMVIAAPYLPRLFGMLGLLTESAFTDDHAAARAIHVLQYLVDGRAETPEHRLILNKVLCGVPLDRPVPRDLALTDAERQAVEGLVAGMIGNWPAIGHTSVTGMRESFLQREGRLTLERDAWRLLVEPRAFDMLLDRLPWSIATLRLPWMDRVLHVEWR